MKISFISSQVTWVFVWFSVASLLESQQFAIRLHPLMYSLFHRTYLVLMWSNLRNITSQYCMKLCNNMAYTSHHWHKPNWPQSFSCSQTFLAAASNLGKFFSDKTSYFFNLSSSQIPFRAEITDISSHQLSPAEVLPKKPVSPQFWRSFWRKDVPKSDCRFESVSLGNKDVMQS